MKRKLRDITASVIGLGLILFGYVNRAKKQIDKNDYITAVYFHNPSKRLFESCVKWLIKNGFTIVSAQDLGEYINKREDLPKRAAWLSLDDGWKDNMENVVPFAAENKIPLTFFIPTESVESSGQYWWRIAEKNTHLLPEPYKSDINGLWKIPEAERMKVITELKPKIKNNSPREAMTVDDIKKISGYDFFTVGSHSVNHVITPNCTSEELDYELGESKRKLEEWTGKEVKWFSYPNGDYSGKETELLKKNGYEFAAAAEDTFITHDTKPYTITRFSVGEAYFAEELCHMTGVWQKFMRKHKKFS